MFRTLFNFNQILNKSNGFRSMNENSKQVNDVGITVESIFLSVMN